MTVPALLAVCLLSAGQPPVAPSGPIALPSEPSTADRLIALARLPKQTIDVYVFAGRDGYTVTVARPIYLRWLAEIERKLAVRPDDIDLLTDAIKVASDLNDEPAQTRFAGRLVAARRSAVEARPADAAARVALADALSGVKDYAAAVAAAEEAVRLAPDAADAWRALGQARLNRDPNDPDVEAAFARRRQLAPTDWQTPLDEANVWCQRAHHLVNAARVAPNVPIGNGMVVANRRQLTPDDCQRLLGLLTRCRHLQKEAVARGSQTIECLRGVAGISAYMAGLWMAADPKSAPATLESTLNHDLITLAEAEAEDARPILLSVGTEKLLAVAAGASGEGLKEIPVSADARLRFERWADRLTAAAPKYEGTDAVEKTMCAAVALQFLGRQPAAVAAARRLVAMTPDTPIAYQILDRTLMDGTPDEVREVLARRTAALATADTPAERLYVARCHEKLGDWPAALTVVEHGLARFPDDPRLTLALVVCHLHRNSNDRIARAAEPFVKIRPTLEKMGCDDATRAEGVRLSVILNALTGRVAAAGMGLLPCGRCGGLPPGHAELTAVLDSLARPSGPSPVLAPASVILPAVER